MNAAARRVRDLLDRVVSGDAVPGNGNRVRGTVAMHYGGEKMSVCVARGGRGRRITVFYGGQPVAGVSGSGPGGYNSHVHDAVEALYLHGLVSVAEKNAFITWLSAEKRAADRERREQELHRLARDLGYQVSPKKDQVI